MPATKTRPTTEYDRDVKSFAAARSRARSLKGRDIGEIPAIANVKRRESCRLDYKRFCMTYNPGAFYLPWADFQNRSAKRIEEVMLQAGGSLYAMAEPRGSGKSVRCRMAILWAISYAHRFYPFLIGANADKAETSLDAIKKFIRFLPLYGVDFPEIAWPAICLGGIANRASGQVSQGESTCIVWGKDRVVLPTVKPPANWPKRWKLRDDGFAPTAGTIIGVSGLTGEGIRGSVETLTTGEQVRPDVVLLDDPQTKESAGSSAQNNDREELVAADVLGMAGPDKAISALMPCTVIKPNDFVDRMLDRSKNPLWRGDRTKMLVSMPTNLAAWDEYFEIRSRCANREPQDFTEANNFYVKRRVILDAGAVASWADRTLPGDVSAVQSAMNLYHRNRRAFFAEYQNDPLPDVEHEVEVVTADWICRKANNLDRRLVPLGCSRLTAFIDVQKAALYFVVAGWADDFTGVVVDYGTWPDQQRLYFTLAEVRVTLEQATKSNSVEAAVYGGLDRLTDQIMNEYRREDGSYLRVERCLVDANWHASTDTVYKFARQTKFAGVVIPSHGKGVTPSTTPFSEYKKKPGERTGLNWRIPNVDGKRAVRHVIFDSNFWKSFVYSRLSVPMGGRGGLELFGRPEAHRMIADHLTAEVRDRHTSEKTNRTVDVWTAKMGRPDNHLFDCVVGAAVGAQIQGVTLPETQASPQPAGPAPRINIAEMQRRAKERAKGKRS